MAGKKTPTGDYPAGYCRPPLDKQWKKGGPSPNPRGRPKRSNDLLDIAKRVGGLRITLTVNGKPTKMTFNEAMVQTAYINYIRDGSWRAAELIADLNRQLRERDRQFQAEDGQPFVFTLKLEDDVPNSERD